MVSLLKCSLLFSLLLSLSSGEEIVHRKKRWLIFPKGSSLQLVYCFLVSTFGTRDGIFVVNITVGLAWEIPQDFRKLLEKESKSSLESRHRRELYYKIEAFLDRQGMDGKSCVLRAICEAKRIAGSKMKFVHTLLHGIFTLPYLDEESEEFEEHMAYKSAEEVEDCAQRFICSLDLLQFK